MIREAVDRGVEAGRRSAGRLCHLLAARLTAEDLGGVFITPSHIQTAQLALRAIGAELAPTSRSGIPLTRSKT